MLGSRVDVTDVRLPRFPVFLPMASCPRRCVYCHQGEITGEGGVPPASVKESLARLETPHEICYFGGSFTCLPEEQRGAYLDAVRSAPEGSVVRFSTHPLCVTGPVLEGLSAHPVSMIELGVSSLDDKVLAACNRGYTGEFALGVMDLVMREGYRLGVQLMTGLPGQSDESSLEDLRRIALLRDRAGVPAVSLRIYPCLVLEKTGLSEMLRRGDYSPPSLDHAVLHAGRMLREAKRLGFLVQRVGLHDTPSLSTNVVAGPYHPAFGELARSVELVACLLEANPAGPWEIDGRRRSMLFGHDRYGLRHLADRTGLSPSRIEGLIRFKEVMTGRRGTNDVPGD